MIKLKIIILHLSDHKSIAVNISLTFLTIFIMVILIRLNRTSILIMIFIISLRDRFLIMIHCFFISNSGPANY